MDQGGEFISNAYKLDCYSKGITIEYTATEEHQANGAAERLNQTISTKLASLILDSRLPASLWPILIRTVGYVRLRTPVAGLNGQTPYSFIHNKLPDLSNLRVIGCKAWMLKTNRKRSMLDKTEECKLLGYAGSQNYVLLTSNNEVVIWHNVQFNELSSATLPCTDESHLETKYKKPRSLENADSGGKDSESIYLGDPIASGYSESPEDSALNPVTSGYSESLQQSQGNSTAPEDSELNQQYPDTPSTQTSRTIPNGPTEGDTIHLHQLESSPPASEILRGTTRSGARYNPLNLMAKAYISQVLIAKQDSREPRTLKEAMDSNDSNKWIEAMNNELSSHEINETWSVVDAVPKGKTTISGRWVFKIKTDINDQIIKYKARWVARGFEQEEGVDYNETYAPVIRSASRKLLFAIAAANNYHIEQMDVVTAFLYSKLSDEIYMEYPAGMDKPQGTLVKLHKSIYGLKQAPKEWYYTLSSYLKQLGFKTLVSDKGIFKKGDLIVSAYVDDLLIFGTNAQEIRDFKKFMTDMFKMTDLGPCHIYLGMEITRDIKAQWICLNQSKYINGVLEHFQMTGCKPETLPLPISLSLLDPPKGYHAPKELLKNYQILIGCLIWLCTSTRVDITYSVFSLARFMSNPLGQHMNAAMHILRYLKETINYSLYFSGSIKPLSGYTDSSWGDCKSTSRSTSGYIFDIGSGPLCWQSGRQKMVTKSSTEAEYVGQSYAASEAVWLRELLREMDLVQGTTIIKADNQGAIALANSEEIHKRSKHIRVHYHYQRELVENQDIKFIYIPTKEMLADGLTKQISEPAFKQMRSKMNILREPPERK